MHLIQENVNIEITEFPEMSNHGWLGMGKRLKKRIFLLVGVSKGDGAIRNAIMVSFLSR